MRRGFWRSILTGMLVVTPMFGAVTVLTVPWDPTNPLSPHTAYPISAVTEVTVVLAATVPSAVGSGDAFMVNWHFGDGSPDANFALTNPYDISTTHQYPASAGVGTAWTAVVTVTDTTANTSGTANYYVTQQKNNLSSRVNVAIDNGLWYMHQTMWRDSVGPVQRGGWDTQIHGCNNVAGLAYDCTYPGVINASNVQAFEVSGHLPSGPAADPYTEDVQRGLARMLQFLAIQGNIAQTYHYNPAAVNYACSTATPGANVNPVNTGSNAYPFCPPASSQVFYNAGATSCLTPPCSVTFDGNSNGQVIFSSDGSGEPIYTTGPFIDALVASGTPNAVAPTGAGPSGPLPGVLGQTYKNIVQDMMDWYSACQYGDDLDLGNPGHSNYVRGGGYSGSGGGWLYNCQQGDDNSTSQWAAIGLIGGFRGFNLVLPQIVKDFNNVWVTNSQGNASGRNPIGPDPWSAGDDNGSAGYRGDIYNSNAWGSFATSPSAMVQMTLDGIGRGRNAVFGDAATDPDQRFNNAETYYADNFCNDPNTGAYAAPRAYTYGMFSFTKSMLLHNLNGPLAPIQFMRTLTPGVFTGNPSVPPDTLDWYSALSPANGGLDACDGVAQTLVGFQSPDGHWYGHDYDQGYQGGQSPFETSWSLIMLKKTVFVSCISNLTGRGSPSGPLTNLAWGAQTNATGYAVLRSSTDGGPYSQVGTTNLTAYRDTNSGLLAHHTYFYVVQPLQGTTGICQSNQAKVVIP
ncbi:MAG: hypothetical protein LAO55_09495 [Acidobacteriia bacterium]|nr:hypothetical protein [Terriglobia bacterium]